MSGQRPGQPARRPVRRVGGTRGRRAPARGGLVVVVAVIVVAVLVFAGLVYFGQNRAQPAATRVAAGHGNVLGDVHAPVTVEEWGDFQ